MGHMSQSGAEEKSCNIARSDNCCATLKWSTRQLEKTFAVFGALSGFVAVACGAFGAHVLRQRLSPDHLAVFETAARYEMYHALALLGVTMARNRWPGAALRVAGWCFVAGTVFFCGSLYILALTGIGWLGAITPLGGVCLLAGWLALAWGLLSSRA